MLVLVVYDISTMDRAGVYRGKRVSKICLNWGNRVQNSVFECELNAEEYRRFKAELNGVINPDKDMLCFYLLGDRYDNRIESLGKQSKRWSCETLVI